jgi:hypothetical protein
MLAQIAKEAGVTHYVWSSAPNIEKRTLGQLNVPHFTGKAKVNKVIRSLGFPYWTIVMPSFFYQNWATTLAPQKGSLLNNRNMTL